MGVVAGLDPSPLEERSALRGGYQRTVGVSSELGRGAKGEGRSELMPLAVPPVMPFAVVPVIPLAGFLKCPSLCFLC